MLLVRFFLLWGLVSLHIVGGAVLFRRFFPRESPWLGFVVPPLALVLVMNFLEHMVAIPSLRGLLPITIVGSLWLIFSKRTYWGGLILPSCIFVGSFFFTLLLRALYPDIQQARDGIYDLQFITSFCMGQSLPVESAWVPPLKLIYYYAFGHYGCSVMIRLFGLDVGTGFNVGAALVSAWIYFLTAGIAWTVSRGKRWITILAPFLVACASNGSVGYMFLTLQNLWPEDIACLYSRYDTHHDGDDKSWLMQHLVNVYTYDRHELLSPGWASWMGIFHSTALGQFLSLFAALCAAIILRRKKVNIPWIGCMAAVPVMLVSSSWGFPYICLLVFTSLGLALYLKRFPLNLRTVLFGVGLVGGCLTPMLLYYTTSSVPPYGPAHGDEHTQVIEFLVQWWPIYLPWLGLLLVCWRVQPIVWIVLFITPLAFTGVEYYSVGARFDMTGKVWGFIFCVAWAVLLPIIATSRSWIFRALFGVIVVNCILSFCFWTNFYWKDAIKWEDIGQLEGKGDLRWDNEKARILNALIPFKNRIIAAGTSSWSFCPSVRIAHFSGNRAYVSWSFNCDNDNFRNGLNEGEKREIQLNALYEGKNPNPLLFLRQHNIDALVIYPDDNIKDEVIEKLKQQLAPTYQYNDTRDLHNHNPPNCGVFIYYPTLANELPSDKQLPAWNEPVKD